MAGQLIPPPELAPPPLEGMTPAQRGKAWLGLLATGEKLVLSGLRRDLAPGGDLRAAYQEWYRQRMVEHDQVIEGMLRRMSQGGSAGVS